MFLIVGLGNPGKKLQKTRHNIGFRVVDKFAKENNFPDFVFAKKISAETSEGLVYNEKTVLAKPQTFMNNSGQAVKILYTKYKILNTNLWVVHDDVDLPLGKIRIVKNRGAAGHKGAESIIKNLGTKDFLRFRIGIKPIGNRQQTMNNTEKLVLQKFDKEEENIVKKVIEKTILALETTIKEGTEKAMNKFNC